MSARIVVLYEDQLGTPQPKNYGPNLLVCACVADRVADVGSPTPWQIREHVEPYPCKGNAKLLTQAKRFVDNGVRPIVIVIDTDRTPPQLNLPANAPIASVRDGIIAWLGSPEGVSVCPLVPNLEAVTDAVAAGLGEPVGNKPKPLARDLLLLRIVGPEAVDQRQRLTAAVPSFAELVDVVLELVVPRLAADGG